MRPFDIPAEPRVIEMAFPTKIVFGAGALAHLPAQLERLGIRRPLVVSDAGVAEAGLVRRLADVLAEAKIAFEVYDQVRPDPTEKDAFAGVACYRERKCDGFIALGGGSPLDAAKLMQLLTTHDPPLSRYDDAAGGDRHVRDGMPPLIAVPTTAGTGSEVSRSAVVFLEDTGRKTVIFSPYLMPKAAVCDPELTYGLPSGPTAATGMDAFTHCVEAFVANGFHPLADALAIDGVARVARSLPLAVKEGDNLQARSDMMVAAIEGAMAFQKGLGACHSLSHALTPMAGLHHGLANAILLPTVMEFNRASVTARLARVAVAMGDNSLSRQEVLAGNAIERVRTLNEEVGIPPRLREVGVKEGDLQAIALKAVQDASHQSNPRKCSHEELLSILRAGW